MKKQNSNPDISDLLEIMTVLRNPDGGCPWDLAQDFSTIAPYTIEEAYEVADAIEREAYDELPGELGDLLLQVVFHAQMGAEAGLFDFADVVAAICGKMIRRHPHIFGDDDAAEGDGVVASSADVIVSWEAIKRRERSAGEALLDGIAAGLPALTRALKLGRRASGVGFDWPSPAPVRAKIDEELAELDAALVDGETERIEAEIGDLLFSVVNLCRHSGVDPERALRGANERFRRRFGRVERAVRSTGGDWSRFDAEALDRLWREAKQAEHS